MVRPVLAVVAVVVLAGCTGFVASERAESVTPAPVPTEAPPYPPGVSDHRIAPSTLTNAHASSLSSNSFTMQTTERITTRDGELLSSQRWLQKVSDNSTAFRGKYRQNGSRFRAGQQRADIDYWTNGSLAAAQYQDQTGTQTRFWRSEDGDDSLGDLSDSLYIQAILSTVEMSVVRHGDDGKTVLRGTSFRNRSKFVTPLSITEPSNVTVRMVVRSGGVVVSQRIEYDAILDGRPVHVTRTSRVTAIGTTTVTQPEWVQNPTQRPSPTVLSG